MKLGNKIYTWAEFRQTFSQRVDKYLEEELAKQKAQGKEFPTDKEIDDLFDKIMKKSLEPQKILTLDEVIDNFTYQYTNGKYTWDGGYLTAGIKLRLFRDIAEIYANQFKYE